MTAEETLTIRKFPVVVETECKMISGIYPTKQELVAKVYDLATRFDVVRRVIVFGSSVTGKCHISSDLDLCIDADVTDGMKIYEVQKAIGDVCNWNCDMVMYSNLGDRLKRTIDKEGVIIYEQPASLLSTQVSPPAYTLLSRTRRNPSYSS